ncbi:threonylcarbamoyl-AMP synthase [Pararhodobacter oceanensis]|uniref:Threonylcarbamoyl-AMP synthase n=2 Tax=Pararhodobacter oceanensis TaxID=2172121 RepID=A0A2T8HYQ1_9RHOB|nr:threonylcarbamoyl-AMP synthase [Pararhodobacter oceanensis]
MKPMLQTLTLPDTADAIAQGAAILRRGGLLALPTETVYGLAGDACNDHAVAGIFAAKGRPSFNPLIVHLAALEQVPDYADLTPLARQLATAFWPGPLTLVLPLRAGSPLSPLVTAGLDSVAIRLPAHPTARELLTAFGGGIAAPSANPSGRISPVTARHVLDGLDGRIDAVIDADACNVGVESTILDARGDTPRLLREGGLAGETIEEALGTRLLPPETSGVTAPGQLASHYAPRGRVRLDVTKPDPAETYIGFGPTEGAALTLSASGDLTEAAANLFHILHKADAEAGPEGSIAFAPIPEIGLGRAINDRLRRAAAPR